MELAAGISVIGLGRLGLPMAAYLAARGFDVVGIDTDRERVEAVNSGEAPFFEPELTEHMRAAKGHLRASTDPSDAARSTTMSFVFVPTPRRSGVGLSNDNVRSAVTSLVTEIARLRRSHRHLIVLRSTLSPGSMDREIVPLIHATCDDAPSRLPVCYNPEFLAVGQVFEGLRRPRFVLIGQADMEAGDLLASLYAQISEPAPVYRKTFIDAELAKLAINAFLTTKISFANTLSRLCQMVPGSNIDEITEVVGADERIGTSFLVGGLPYGGPCFMKDTPAFNDFGRRLGVSMDVTEAADRSNSLHLAWLCDLVAEHTPQRGHVGIIGLSYKPNTDSFDGSPSVELAARLVALGYPVEMYDPHAPGHALLVSGNPAKRAETLQSCLNVSDTIVVMTPLPGLEQTIVDTLKDEERPNTIIDCWRHVPQLSAAQGITYVGLGIGPDSGDWAE